MNIKKLNCLESGRNRSLAALAFASALTAGLPAAAQTNIPAPTTLDAKALSQLLQRLDAQEAEINDLKSKLGTTTDEVKDEMAAGSKPPAYPNLQFHGFGDVDYHASTRLGIPNAQGVTYNPPANHSGNSFYLGELDLYVQSQLAENISFLNETVVSSGTDNRCGLDIERMELSWHPSDYFNVDVGRFHTQLGYYNTAYHHGTWFQNAIGRPFFLEYEDSGGLLPVHTIGVSVHGAIPSGSLNLTYYVEAGNGESYSTTGNPVQNEIDNNKSKAVNLALVAQPEWFPGGQFGVGAYHDTVSPTGLPTTDEWIWNAHVAYHSALYELLAEGYLTRHQPSGDTAHYSTMFYVQASRKFGKYVPYARFTYTHTPESDLIYSTILNTGGLDYGPSLGLRYDFSTYVALKVQYDYVVQTGFKNANELSLQAAFTF